MKRAVFLDRDGVLNAVVLRDGTPHPPDGVNEVEILPGVAEALERLRAGGFALIVVTNQPDIARGTQTAAGVAAINAYLAERLGVDEFCICPHDDGDGCECRKPKPGLIVEAARRRGIDLAGSFMVGDRAGDVLAGAAAGCRTLLVSRAYSKQETCRPDYIVGGLAEAAAVILGPAGSR
jgi:D-glycero-D-manno-heptose 1,7-bisphosphate phosphatase